MKPRLFPLVMPATAALRYPDHKVVLSAFGMDNYISKLEGDAKANAFDIGVANMRALIARLQELKKPLSYTDRAQDLPFWQQVNQRLTTAIGYEGKLSGT
jgi:hypothetical protein